MRKIQRTASGAKRTLVDAKRSALLALSVALSLAGTSYAQVMGKVPPDALVVIKVSNLSQTSAKVAKLAETLGINAFVPQLNDPLAALKQQLKIGDGLKDDGELAFVYLDPKASGTAIEEGKSMLILVPTSDYAALTGNIEGATKDGELTVTKGKDGEDMFIADWGDYAAVSPTKELLAAAPSEAIKLPARAAKEMGATDLGLYANFAKLREPLTAELAKNKEESRQTMLEEMKGQGQVPEKFHPVAGAAFDQVFAALEGFLRDADAATIGFTITDNGIKENIVAEFKEGSYLGKTVADLGKGDGALLSNLPLGKYLVYGGMTVTPKVVNQLIDDVGGPILAALPPDEELKVVPEYVESLKAMLAEVKSYNLAVIAPQGALGQEAMFQFVSSATGDGAKITAQMREMNAKYAKVMSDLAAGAAQGAEMKQEVTENAKEIDGVKFDLVSTEFLGDSPAANQQRQMMQLMYGGPKAEVYIGNAGDSVLSFAGASDDAVKALVAAAAGNQSPLAGVESVKSVTGELPAGRIVEAYVQVDEIVALGLRVANQFGMAQGNIQLPPDLQPIGISLSGEGSSLELNYYVSNDLLQALVSAALQMQQMMQGGGGGAPGGGL